MIIARLFWTASNRQMLALISEASDFWNDGTYSSLSTLYCVSAVTSLTCTSS